MPGSFNARLVSYESPQVIDTAVILAKEVVFDGDVLELSDNITQFIVVAETIRSSPGSTIRWEGAGLTAPNHGTTIPPVAPIGAPNWDPHDGTGGTFDRRNGGNGFDGAAHTTSGEILRYSFPNGNTPSVFSGNAELAAVNDSYNGMRIEFTSGDLAGQWSTISDYSAFLRRITVTSAFSETPAKTDTFRIIHDFRAKTGNIGRSAPDVIFYVKHFTRELNISGTAHTYQASLPDLDLRGERGGRGQTGQAGGPGGDGAKGLRADSGTFDCQRGPGYGGHGGDGGNGGPGGHGGAGGAGGDILVQYVEFPADTNLQAASMLTLGGARGLGGAGGAGGPGGEGGDAGNPDDPWCDARPGRAGDDGQPGAAGPAGSLGAPGQLAQKTFAPIPLSTWEEAFTKPYLVRAEDAHVTETVVFETLNICGPDTSCPAPHLIARDDLDGSMHTFFLDAIAPDRYNWTIPDSMDAGTYTVFIRRADTKETNTYRVEVLPLVEEIWLAEEFDARPAGTAYLVGLGLRPDVEIVYDGVRILPEVLYDSSSPNAEQPPPDESPAARDLIQFTIPLLATSGNYFSRDNGQTPHTIYLDQPFPLANSDPVSLTLKRTDGMKFLPSVNGFDFPNGEMFAEVQDWVGRDGFLGGLFGSDGLGGRAYDAFRDVYGQGEIDALGGTANPIVWANFGLWYSYMVNPFRPNNKGFGYGACFGLATLSLHDFFEGIATEDGKTVDELARGISVIHGRQNSDEIQLLQVAETVLDAVSTAIGGPTMTEIAARYIAGFFRQANDGDGLRYAPVMSFIPSSGAYADVLVQTVNLIGETINLWDGISPQESYEDLLGAFNTLKSAFERSHTVTPYRVVYDDPADTLPSRIYFYDNNIPGSPGNDIYLDIYREGGRVKFKYTGHYATDPHPSPDEDLDTPGGFMLSVVPIGLPLGNVDMLLDFGQSIWGTHIEETVGIYNTVRLLLDASQFLGEIPGIDVESQQISSAGTVRFVDQDGGFYGIVADNGVRFEPLALTTEFQVDGLRVHFAGATQPEQGPQSHHWGIPLSVNLIEAINELPAAPTVTGPAAVTAGTTPEITWTAVEAAARYELQVTDLATSQTVIQAPSVAGTSLTPGTPLTAGHYRVLVRGINNLSEAGQWSAPYDFEIALATSTPGDFDHDGAVNDQDIDVLLAEITLGMNRTLYDLTGDLWVDAADATYLVETILATHFGDANLDGLVDAADAAILAANFGWTGGAAWRRGNFNGDAAVDLVDLAMQQSHFGLGDPMASPPAPQAVLATQPAPHARANARRNDTVTIRAARHPAQPTIPRPPAATSGASTSQPVASTLIGRRAARRPRPSPAEPSRSLTARVPLTTRVVDSLFAEPG